PRLRSGLGTAGAQQEPFCSAKRISHSSLVWSADPAARRSSTPGPWSAGRTTAPRPRSAAPAARGGPVTENRTSYPVRVDAPPDPAASRGLWLIKWLLLIPHFVVLVF